MAPSRTWPNLRSFATQKITITRRGFLRNLSAQIGLFGGVALSAGNPFLRGPAAGTLQAQQTPVLFEEVPATTTGITWRHVNGRSQQYYLPETTGAGCAFLDYDNDGWMDIYLVNSGKCDFFTADPPLRNALYKNNRDGSFTDVTEKAGVGAGGYGMGVAVGDYNGDGFPDLYVTQYGRSILYRNNGDGTFTNVTEEAGVAAPGWSTSAVWFDYDKDGKLDLFVCRLADFDNDGAVDVLVAVNDGAPVLLKNSAAQGNHWLGLRLRGGKSNPDAIGARISWQAGDLKRTRLKVGGGSYLSSHDPREVLGIGKRTKIDKLEIRWPLPSSKIETFTELPLDRYITLVEGEGIQRT